MKLVLGNAKPAFLICQKVTHKLVNKQPYASPRHVTFNLRSTVSGSRTIEDRKWRTEEIFYFGQRRKIEKKLSRAI